MIQTQTILKVVDNSGAKAAKCIKILGGFRKKIANIGDLVVVSIQEIRNKTKETTKIKKKETCKGLIIRTKKKTKKKTGESIKFEENAIVLLNKQNMPLANRISGVLLKKLKKKKFQKFINLASQTI